MVSIENILKVEIVKVYIANNSQLHTYTRYVYKIKLQLTKDSFIMFFYISVDILLLKI